MDFMSFKTTLLLYYDDCHSYITKYKKLDYKMCKLNEILKAFTLLSQWEPTHMRSTVILLKLWETTGIEKENYKWEKVGGPLSSHCYTGTALITDLGSISPEDF